jgi:hypothetical protein
MEVISDTGLLSFHSIRTRLQFHYVLVCLFSSSFLIHLFVALVFINQPIALDDMFQYDMIARSLKNGFGYRWYSKADIEVLEPYYSKFLDLGHLSFPENGLLTTFRAPGYPFFLALLYLVVPETSRFVIARIFQAGLMALISPLCAYLAYQLKCQSKTIIFTGVLSALYPMFLFYPIGLASENLYIVQGISSLVAMIYSGNHKKFRWTFIAAFLCGITMLSRCAYR